MFVRNNNERLVSNYDITGSLHGLGNDSSRPEKVREIILVLKMKG